MEGPAVTLDIVAGGRRLHVDRVVLFFFEKKLSWNLVTWQRIIDYNKVIVLLAVFHLLHKTMRKGKGWCGVRAILM
jgi:hypothetical protein